MLDVVYQQVIFCPGNIIVKIHVDGRVSGQYLMGRRIQLGTWRFSMFRPTVKWHGCLSLQEIQFHSALLLVVGIWRMTIPCCMSSGEMSTIMAICSRCLGIMTLQMKEDTWHTLASVLWRLWIYWFWSEIIIWGINVRCCWQALFERTWWRHQMETFSALLAICAGNSPVPGEFPFQRPATRSFDVFFDLRLNKRLSKQS